MIFVLEMKSTHCTTIVFHRIRMNPESRLFFSYFFRKGQKMAFGCHFSNVLGSTFCVEILILLVIFSMARS